MNGTTPEQDPLPRICEDPEREEDYRKTLHCDVCDRDFKGDTQFRNHLKSKSHRKSVQALEDNYVYETRLVKFDENNKNEVALLIKNIFSISLSEVMAMINNLPVKLDQSNSSKKAKKIANELSKHYNIIAEVSRVQVSKEEETPTAE